MRNYIICMLSLVGLLYSCTDIIEEEIDDEEIILLAPADLLRTKVIQHTFWWEEVEGANEYRLQMVSPHFDTIEKLVMDTVVSTNSFPYTMTPGRYQWRVRGENSNSATPFTTATLYIDSTLDISSQQIELLSPLDGVSSNDDSQVFEWQAVYNADHYSFEIRRNNETGSLLIAADNLLESYYEYTFDEEGIFYWKVQGYNNASNTNTPFSSQSLLIDTTVPAIPNLSNPNDNDLISQSSDDIYTLEWSAEEADSNESEVDSWLYVSAVNSSSFTSVSPIVLPVNGTNMSYNIELDLTGEYYWKVKTVDVAGNESAFSETNSFTIQ